MTALLHAQIQALRKYQAWRTGEDTRTMDEAGIVPREITVALDLVLEVATRACNLQPSDDRQQSGEPFGYVYETPMGDRFFVLKGESQCISNSWTETPVYTAPQPQQIPEGYKRTLRDFFAALDKANALDRPSSAWVNRPNGSFGDRLQAWAEVNRLRAMLEAAPNHEPT